MRSQKGVNEHWSDGQLIAHLYGVGPEDGHLAACAECTARFEAMAACGETLRHVTAANEVTSDFLAAQRRSIYARLDEKPSWWAVSSAMQRWAPVLAMVALMAGGVTLYEQQHAGRTDDAISDAELVQQVSQIAEDSTPPAVAPIEVLFGD